MLKLVRFESERMPVYVNPQAVTCVKQNQFGLGCRILFDSHSVDLDESADEVAALLEKAVSGDNA